MGVSAGDASPEVWPELLDMGFHIRSDLRNRSCAPCNLRSPSRALLLWHVRESLLPESLPPLRTAATHCQEQPGPTSHVPPGKVGVHAQVRLLGELATQGRGAAVAGAMRRAARAAADAGPSRRAAWTWRRSVRPTCSSSSGGARSGSRLPASLGHQPAHPAQLLARHRERRRSA